jgi:exopolysaccharide production protein ExoQ
MSYGATMIPTKQNISHLVLTWILMIPLFYFASMGNLWFESALKNDPLSFAGGNLVVTAPTSPSGQLISAMILGVTLLIMLPRVKSIVALSHEDKVFSSMALLALASCLWSQLPKSSLIYSLLLILNTIFGFYLCRRYDHEELQKIVRMIGWICFTFSILLALFFPSYGVDQSGSSEGGWRGMFPGKNPCAEMTVFLLSVAFFSPAATVLSRVLRIIYILLGTLIIVMSKSVTGYLLLGVLLVYVCGFWLISRFRRTDKIVISLIFGAVILAIVVLGSVYFRELTYLLGKDPTLTGRSNIWAAVMTSVMKRPILGYGYMAFWRGLQGESGNVSLASHWIVPHAHNGFLEVWLQLGIVGLALIGWSLSRAFKDMCTCLIAKTPSYVSWYGCIVVLMMLYAVDEPPFLRFGLIWILYIIACVGLVERATQIRLGMIHE